MEVKLDIDPTKFTAVAEDIFKSLTAEQKNGLALDILTKWLKEPYDFERNTFEEVTAKEMLNDPNFKLCYKEKTLANIKDSYEYKQKVGCFKSSREQMIQSIVQGTTKLFHDEIQKLISTDPQIQEMKQKVLDTIKEAFPKTVHDALTMLLVAQMQNMSTQISSALMQSDTSNRALNNLYQKLLPNELRTY